MKKETNWSSFSRLLVLVFVSGVAVKEKLVFNKYMCKLCVGDFYFGRSCGVVYWAQRAAVAVCSFVCSAQQPTGAVNHLALQI